MPSKHLGPYPIFQPEDFRADAKRINAYYNDRANNPYCLKKSGMVFSENVTSLVKATDRASSKRKIVPQIESTHFSDPMAELVSYQGPFRYNMMKGAVEDDEQLLTSFEIIPGDSADTETVALSRQREQIFNFNWENLGNRFVPVESPFASECNAALHLKALKANHRCGESNEIWIVRNDDFLGDVKFLLTGTSSRCFQYGEGNRFLMVGNFTVDGISPLSIKGVIDQFVELGTCFRRLQKMTRKNPYNHAMILEGFVFKAFCDCVERILRCFEIVVNSYEGRSLLQLQRKIEPMRKQILALAKFCGIHPDCEWLMAGDLRRGSCSNSALIRFRRKR